MRDGKACRSEQLYIWCEIGAPNRADRYALLVEVNVQRLGEGRDEEPLGITFDQNDAAGKEQFASRHVDVALKVGFVRRG